MDAEITVKGPGGCIAHEVYRIAEYLKSIGYEVEINDNHPPKDLDKIGLDCYGEPITGKIKIIAEHMPWGG